MARGKNQVTLTFAGDESDLTKSFDRVGASADEMKSEVGSASRSVRDSGESFDRAREKSDALDTSAMGFRDTMTGVGDTMKGTAEIAKGNLFEGFLTLGMGVGDLASGFTNLLIPAMKNGVTWLKNTRVAQIALNTAMRANPIGIVITVLAALVGAFVLAYKKSETFRDIVQGAWKGVKIAASATWDFMKGVFNWFTELPGGIGAAFSTLADIITRPFRDAFDAVKWLWNSTVGGFGFTVPTWVPKVGGNSFRIPNMHTGGIVPGAPGQERLMMMQAGEQVTPVGGAPRSSSSRTVIELRSDGSRLGDGLLALLAEAIQARGGDTQLVLGGADG